MDLDHRTVKLHRYWSQEQMSRPDTSETHLDSKFIKIITSFIVFAF